MWFRDVPLIARAHHGFLNDADNRCNLIGVTARERSFRFCSELLGKTWGVISISLT